MPLRYIYVAMNTKSVVRSRLGIFEFLVIDVYSATLFRQRLLVCTEAQDSLFEEVLATSKQFTGDSQWSSEENLWFAVESFNQGVHAFRFG